MTTAPVKKFRLGRITATVWNNPNEKGEDRYSASIVRTYKDGDAWKETSSFFPEDLPVVSRLTDRALNHIMLRMEGLE
ncbi:MAG: hypothetical protein AAFV59_04535 [Pseudomonadota bacterium]